MFPLLSFQTRLCVPYKGLGQWKKNFPALLSHLPIGIGEPVFDKLQAVLGQALFSIGAVIFFEFGDVFCV